MKTMNMKWLKLLGISVLFLVMQSACKKDLLPNGFYSVEDIIIYPNGNIDTVKYKASGGEFKKSIELSFYSDSSSLFCSNTFNFQSKYSHTTIDFVKTADFNIVDYIKTKDGLYIERQEKNGEYKSIMTYKFME